MDLITDYRRKIIANSPHLASASGAVVSFSDGADLPLKSLNVDIEPVQDLHGYDSPWPAGGGVNKIDYLSCIGIGGRDGTDSIFGNNTSISGNQLTINRSYAQGGGLLKGVGVFPMSTGDKVTISGSVTLTNTNRMYVGVGNYDGGGTNGYLAVTPSSGKFVVTVTAGSDYAKTGIFLQPESANSSMVVSNVMVALGGTEKPYEPYENICPISGWTQVGVEQRGKNLCSSPLGRHNWANGVRYSNSTGYYCATENKVKVKGGQTYTVSFINAGTTNGVYCAWFCGDTFLSQTNFYSANIGVVTAPNNADSMAITFRNTSAYEGDATVSEVTIEVGSTATPYEPYNGVTVTIQLGQTVYGGTLNPLTGVLTVDRANISITDYLATSIQNNGVRNGNQLIVLPVTGKKPGTDNFISNLFFISSSAVGKYTMRGRAATTSVEFEIPFSALGVTETDPINVRLSAAKQWFTDNPTQLCCELATPYTIQLTPQQIRTLYGNNTIYAATGNVALEYWAHP